MMTMPPTTTTATMMMATMVRRVGGVGVGVLSRASSSAGRLTAGPVVVVVDYDYKDCENDDHIERGSRSRSSSRRLTRSTQGSCSSAGCRGCRCCDRDSRRRSRPSAAAAAAAAAARTTRWEPTGSCRRAPSSLPFRRAAGLAAPGLPTPPTSWSPWSPWSPSPWSLSQAAAASSAAAASFASTHNYSLSLRPTAARRFSSLPEEPRQRQQQLPPEQSGRHEPTAPRTAETETPTVTDDDAADDYDDSRGWGAGAAAGDHGFREEEHSLQRLLLPEREGWNVNPDLAPFVRANLSCSNREITKAAAHLLELMTTAATVPATADNNNNRDDNNDINNDNNKNHNDDNSNHDDDTLSLIWKQQHVLRQAQKFKDEIALDTGLSVVLLGTGAGKQSLEYGNPATAVKMAGTTYLIDAGEGVQIALMKSRIKRGHLRKIFSTSPQGPAVALRAPPRLTRSACCPQSRTCTATTSWGCRACFCRFS
jgi:hypothetical protein